MVFFKRLWETDCTALTGCDWSKKEDIKRYFEDQIRKDNYFCQFDYAVEKCIAEKASAFFMFPQNYDLEF